MNDEGVRNGQITSSTTRGRGGGSASATPGSSGCSSAASRSPAATALHNDHTSQTALQSARRAGDGSGASSSGSDGVAWDPVRDSSNTLLSGSTDGESDGVGCNSGDVSEKGFFGFVDDFLLDDHLSEEDYAYSLPIGVLNTQGVAVSRKPTLNPKPA